MGSFTTGLVTGCLIGVSGTFLLLIAGVALSKESSPLWNRHSFREAAFIAVIIACVAAFGHLLSFKRIDVVLLLLLTVLAISKLGGLVNGLIASSVAALILALCFFPPLGSLMIKRAGDRLALALFLLISAFGSHLLGRREKSAQ